MNFIEPYVIVDAFGEKNADGELFCGILNEVKNALGLRVLNYQYGYINELNETLKQYTENSETESRKFPLVWLQQPFTIIKDTTSITYGTIETVRLFFCVQTETNLKSYERMAQNFKPQIYPLYYKTMEKIDESLAFLTQSANQIDHAFTDRYFWGPDEEIFGDKIDCSMVTLRNLVLSNKLCLPFKSF